MFETVIDELDAEATLTHAADLRALADRAEVQILVTAAHFADLHAHLDPADGGSLPGTQRLVDLGGDATPAVAEFAPADLGAELAMSPYAAARLIADALDLRHRLPLLWGRVQAGQVKPWIGRRIASTTRTLSVSIAAAVDAAVTPWAHCLTWARLDTLIAATIIRADPPSASHAAQAAEQSQGVWLAPSTDHGVKTIYIRTTAPHAIWFDATIDRIADNLKLLGDPTSKDIRRATAVGILARDHTLDIPTTTGHTNGEDPTQIITDRVAGGDADRADAKVARRSRSRPGRGQRPPATLYIHLGPNTLTLNNGGSNSSGGGSGAGSPVARFEGVGPITIDQARKFLGHCHVTITPVLDLARQAPVDAYEIPDRMREAIHLRTPVDAFPYATNTARTKDLDHTRPHTATGNADRVLDPGSPGSAGGPGNAAGTGDAAHSNNGPPGQTRTDNLEPLTRFHHRIKTHGRWQIRQPFDGIFIWKSPHGRYFLVDHTGTQRLRPNSTDEPMAMGLGAAPAQSAGRTTSARCVRSSLESSRSSRD